MNHSTINRRFRLPLLALAASLVITACGGSSSSNNNDQDGRTPTTGTVVLLFTDKPTDEFSAIKLNVVEAILIGGDDGQQSLFQGSEPIDLLDLTNFNEPIVFGEVTAGIYTKLRLVIDALELVPKDGTDSIFPKLPANGKIDLLDPSGIEVLPGRTLLVEVDMEANKAIKITRTGNSNKYNFRPVVKANFMVGGLPDKLARVEGVASEIFADPAGSFKLCDIETPDSCIDVTTGAGTSIFDSEGLGTDLSTLMVNDPVVVIGRYVVDTDITLDALVLEIGGNAEQVKGNVVSAPMDNQFLMVIDENGDIVVELQPGTKYYDADGQLGPDAIVLGTDIEVEGVRPAKADPADPDLIRAALIFVEAEDDEQVSGTIILPLDAATRSFGLTLAGGGDISVTVLEGADILLVDTAASEVT
ncbi:MAG: DUF4382 domain-containing protein, partial [Gammaproteobacteria bacterium]|nr:DUF4382 domain-containing protein [Gammaproteobacteria bacterium]